MAGAVCRCMARRWDTHRGGADAHVRRRCWSGCLLVNVAAGSLAARPHTHADTLPCNGAIGLAVRGACHNAAIGSRVPELRPVVKR